MRRPAVTIAVILLIAAPALAQEAPRIDLDAKDEDLDSVIAAIAKRSGQKVVVDYGVKARLTLRARDLHWRDAVELAALKTGCRIEKDFRGLVLTRPPRGRFKAGPAPARAVLMLLARAHRLNIILGPGLDQPVRVDLEDFRIEQALRDIARGAGRYRAVEGWKRLWRIEPDPLPEIGLSPADEVTEVRDFEGLPAEARKAIDLNAINKDLKTTLGELAREVRVPLTIDPKINETLTLRVKQLPWIETLRIIAELTGCPLRLTEDGLAIDAPVRLTMREDAIGARAGLTKIAAEAGRRVRLPKCFPAGPVSFQLREVPWQDAARGLLRTLGDYRMSLTAEELIVEPRPTKAKPGPVLAAPKDEEALGKEMMDLVTGLKGLSEAELEAAMKSLGPKIERRLAETGERGEALLFEAIQEQRLEGPAVDLLDVCANRAAMMESEALIARMIRAVEDDPSVDLTEWRAAMARQILRLKGWKNRYGEVCVAELRKKMVAISLLQKRLAPLAGERIDVQGTLHFTTALINGRFYESKDEVLPGLTVARVDDGAVKLLYKGTTFWRRVP